ncbi:hypothetical protein ACJX0J_003772 [Zea mays]
MEPLVGYSPDKSQNMVLMGGLRKYVPITRTTFYVVHFLFVVFHLLLASGLTAFYMFRIYLLTFDGYLRKVRCIQYPYGKNTPFGAKNTFVYPHETGNTMLFPLLILLLFTLFIGSIGIHFDNGVKDNRILELTILSNKKKRYTAGHIIVGFYPRCH